MRYCRCALFAAMLLGGVGLANAQFLKCPPDQCPNAPNSIGERPHQATQGTARSIKSLSSSGQKHNQFNMPQTPHNAYGNVTPVLHSNLDNGARKPALQSSQMPNQYTCTIDNDQTDAGDSCVLRTFAAHNSGDRCRCGGQRGTMD